MNSQRRSRSARRRLRHEWLESRCLLAGLVGSSPWQNPLSAIDLDADGVVSPSDAIAAINALNGGLGGSLAGRVAPTALHGQVAGALAEFLDADGDSNLSPTDAVLVINALNNRGPSNPSDDLPAEDQQPDVIGDTVPELVLTQGGAKVRARLNIAGDIDVFRVVPTKGQLSVALFAPRGADMTVTVVDAAGTEIDSASTGDAGSKRLARLNVEVETGDSYFVLVSGGADVTGTYGLQVLNFDARDFKPRTDSELGDDIHGDEATPASATNLELAPRHARVSSNIDDAGDRDVFEVDATDGKLIIQAGAEFDLDLEVLDADGEVIATKAFPDRRPLFISTTAGTYFIAVSAANGTSTGAYRLNVVNPGGPKPHDDDPVDPSDPSNDPAIPDAIAEIFARVDKNGDGAVALVELRAGAPVMLKLRPLDKIFEQWDTNSSGGLTLDEFTAGLATLRPDRPHGSSDDDRPLLRRIFG